MSSFQIAAGLCWITTMTLALIVFICPKEIQQRHPRAAETIGSLLIASLVLFVGIIIFGVLTHSGHKL